MNNNVLFENLETERLILRKVEVSDAAMLYNNLFNKPDYFKFYTSAVVNSFSDYQNIVNNYQGWYQSGTHFRWGIVLKETNEMIGLVNLHTKDFINDNCRIGYAIGYNYNHHGYANEAIKKVVDFGFNKLKMHRIEALIVTSNEPSKKAAENAGFHYEATRKDSYKLIDKYYDQDVYVIINDN